MKFQKSKTIIYSIFLIILILIFSGCSISQEQTKNYFEKFLLEKNVNNYTILDDYSILDTQSKDIYISSYPIISKYTNQIIDPSFYEDETDKNLFYALLYDCKVELPKNIQEQPIRFITEKGEIAIQLCGSSARKGKIRSFIDMLGEKRQSILYSKLFNSNSDVYVYTGNNGIAMEIRISDISQIQGNTLDFMITVDTDSNLFYENRKYYSTIMSDKEQPYFIIQSMFHLNGSEILLNEINISTVDFGEFKLSLDIQKIKEEKISGDSGDIVIPITLESYCPKVMFDTAAFSKEDNANTVYSNYNFLGNSPQFGEEYLYLRLDNRKISNLINKPLDTVLYIKKFNDYNYHEYPPAFEVFKMQDTWCSFETTWKSKKQTDAFLFEICDIKKHFEIDMSCVTDVIITTPLIEDEPGILIKRKENSSGYQILASADNMLFPYILQLKVK